ncbi:hypothetical protein BpHYR1_051174 [Brachionus plicatilis]|uniref:Uncharacterized protein n=1 Tax=Brachionus plicatilis TaxID=10195 RepID=A0A3M7P6U9_BRAPC|nr:hypothetical protein BpHYR1_051174 [Brachionus plicatilis]
MFKIKYNEKSGSNAQIPSLFSPHQRRIHFFEPSFEPQTKRHSQFRKRECLNFSASKVTAIQRGSAVKQVLALLRFYTG